MPKIVEWKTVDCYICGTGISKRVTDMARSLTGRFYCSKECQHTPGARPPKRAPRECPECETMFAPLEETHTYCSAECRNESQRKHPIKPCGWCKKDFATCPGKREKFCSRDCFTKASRKNALEREHNGKPALMNYAGYVVIYEPDHPASSHSGWVLEHRWVMEQALGRRLSSDEHVHHLNHVRDDNRLENLQILSNSEHGVITGRENGEALKAALEARQRLAQYEAIYGALPIVQGQPA